MNSILKSAQWLFCCLLIPLGFVKSDQQQLIKRITNADRNMVVSWDGSISAKDILRMGIHPNSSLYLLILTNGVDVPLEDKDEDGRVLAYGKRRYVFELAQRLNAQYAFLNLSFLEADDSSIVVDRVAEKIKEFFPSKVYFIHPKGKDVNLGFVREKLGKGSGVRKHYAMPVSALKQEKTANPAHEAWSFGLRYRQAQRKSIESYKTFTNSLVKGLLDDRTSKEDRIRESFAAVKWIEKAMKLDSSRVFRTCMSDKKWLIEELRSRMIGFDVDCTISDSAMTAMEAVKLNIGEFHNAGAVDTLYAVFPNYKDRWAINARIWSSYYVHRNSTIAVFSPADIQFTVHTDGNFETEYFQYPYEVIFVRFDSRPEYNCLVKKTFYIDLTPKITIDYTPSILLTGIDKAIEFTLTSYSVDALADSIYLEDFILDSPKQYFRLAGKYASKTLTLDLNWKNSNPVKGKLAHPALIGGVRIGAIPSDPITVPQPRGNLFLHSRLKKSSVEESFKRTQYGFLPYEQGTELRAGDKVFIDRNSPLSTSQQGQLLEQVRGGATAICLLEGNSWLSNWTADSADSFRTDAHFFYEVRANVDTTLFKDSGYFDNWLFHFTSTRVSNIGESEVWIEDVHNNNPLIFSKVVGSGRVVFVNLALSTQLVNTNVNAIKLLLALCSADI